MKLKFIFLGKSDPKSVSSLIEKYLKPLEMTKKEKNFPDIVKASRKIRISKGSGTSVQDINKLLKQFKKMSQMMKKMGKNKNLENMMSSGQMGDLQSLLNKNKF